MTNIVDRLRGHIGEDHVRLCQGREYLCTCGYDENTGRILAEAADEIGRLTTENWQLKGALGYPVPGHVMDNSGFKCGLCEAKAIEIAELRAEYDRLQRAYDQLRETYLGSQKIAPSLSWDGFMVSGLGSSLDEVYSLVLAAKRLPELGAEVERVREWVRASHEEVQA